MEDVSELLALVVLETLIALTNVKAIRNIDSGVATSRDRSAHDSGLMMAIIMRPLFLLASIIPLGWLEPQAALSGLSGRDIILLAGGSWLIGRAAWGLAAWGLAEPPMHHRSKGGSQPVFFRLFPTNIAFAFDALFVALSMTPVLWVMIASLTAACGLIFLSRYVGAAWLDRQPAWQSLVWSLLLPSGFVLLVDSWRMPIPRTVLHVTLVIAVSVFFVRLIVINFANPRREQELKDKGE